MRQRYNEMMQKVDARVDGQKFLNIDGGIYPAQMAQLKLIRDNPLPNTPHHDAQLDNLALMFNSRKPGA